MKRKTLVVTGVATAVVLALGGGYAYSASNSRPLVGVAAAQVGPLDVTVSASGSLVPSRTAGVYPPTSGTLASVAVHDGDTVKAGQVLAVMASGPLKLARAQARAARSAAEAQLAAVNNGAPLAIERSAAAAGLSAARSQLSTAKRNYASFLDDYRDAATAERHQMLPTLRTLKSARSTASAALLAARAALSRLSASGRVALARRAAEEAVTATSRALRQAEQHLAAKELTAPFAGTVTLRGGVEKGAGATVGVALFTVTDHGRMEFEAQVNETDIAAVEKGQPASVLLDAFPDGFAGSVTRVQASPVTTATGSIAFPVRVSLDAGGSRLFQGMSGSADLTVRSIPDALTVPVEALLGTGAARTVFLLGPDDTVHSRPVTIGASTDTAVQVLTGLSAGDRVVTTGASALSDGQAVRTR